MDKFKEIVDSRDYDKMVGFGKHPLPGEYVITGMQAGNLRGEKGWQFYIGYVVQVRKKAGDFGSDMVLLRHPDGTLMQHTNQAYFRMGDAWTKKAMTMFETTPDTEDYTKPYTLGNGMYPEAGAIIEPNDHGPEPNNSPMMKITVSRPDGTKTVEIC